MRLDPCLFPQPPRSPLALKLPDCLGPQQGLILWPLGLTLCPLFTLPIPSWCSAKSAVTLSIHSVWRRPSGPCLNIMTPGAAAAASFAMSVGAKAGDPRFGHRSHEGGGMEEGGVLVPIGSAIAVFLPTSNSTSWSVSAAAMLTTQPVWGPATQLGPHANGATG